MNNNMFDGFCYNNTKHLLYLKKSNIPNAGLGVFTLKKIPAETLIGYYEGTLYKGNNNVTDYSFELSKQYYLDASEYPRCYIAMINDSYGSKYNNNCEFRMIYYDHNKKLLPPKKRKIALYSIKTIYKNEELMANYGDEYWTTRSI